MNIVIPQPLFQIETQRLKLICCDREILEALFRGNDSLAGHLQVNVPQKWTEFGAPAFKFTYDKILSGSGQIEWWSYLPVVKEENTLIGSCGYKGEPKDGRVEIGYEVTAAYRGIGLATEMAKALIEKAFQSNEVQYVEAHTLAEINESGSVLKKCGLRKTAELEDPEDGKIWKWEIRK